MNKPYHAIIIQAIKKTDLFRLFNFLIQEGAARQNVSFCLRDEETYLGFLIIRRVLRWRLGESFRGLPFS